MKFVVQVFCTGIGWADSKYGGNTKEEADQAETSMLVDDAIWLSGKRITRVIEK